MPKREKKNCDTVAVSRFTTQIMFDLSFSILLFIVLFVAVIGFMLICEQSNKFKR